MSALVWFSFILAIKTSLYVRGDNAWCSRNAMLAKCLSPHFNDYEGYETVGTSGATKIVNDQLKVLCEKVTKSVSCLKKEFPVCSYGQLIPGYVRWLYFTNLDVLPHKNADKSFDVLLHHICVEKYTVYSAAKNCLITQREEILDTMTRHSCRPTFASEIDPDEWARREKKDEKEMCTKFDSTIHRCVFNSVALVCGRPVIDETKALIFKLCNISQNIALFRNTAQSSTWDSNSDSSKAVDGNTNTDFYSGKSCMHTLNDTNAWWAVDLGCQARIEEVIIFNRGDDKVGDRLRNFIVGLSDNDPRVMTPRYDLDETSPKRRNYGLCKHYTYRAGDGERMSFDWCWQGNRGRYVIIQMPSGRNFLHVCEVMVRGECIKPEENLAFGKKTAQSSTYRTGDSPKAVDGNSNPNYFDGSCAHTQSDANAWWAVDLDCTARIDTVTITNRGDNGNGHRLHDFNVAISNTDPTITRPTRSNYNLCALHKGPVGEGVTLSFSCKNFRQNVGRYVIIQIPGETKNILTLCEVEVIGECTTNESHQRCHSTPSFMMTS